MASNVDSPDRWVFHPVNPRELFQRLCNALNLYPVKPGIDDRCWSEEVASLPLPDVSSETFRDSYLLKEVLRKSPDLDLGIDTAQVALDSFLADERANAETNSRLGSCVPEDLGLRTILHRAALKIAAVLGEFRPDEFADGVRFGPGSTVTLDRKESGVYNKLSRTPSCTADALKLAYRVIGDSPIWLDSLRLASDADVAEPWSLALTVCQFDRWTSVAKNAKTDRGIGIPPDCNVMLQLALGRMMRSRLFHRGGIDLQDQSKNQRLALQASVDGENATVDVRAASQSVTYALVYLLLATLPASIMDPRWFTALDMLRTTYSLLPNGVLHENELFSSMGNGYTFELETLVFWAISCAVCEDLGLPSRVSTYGDDIVLPSAAYPRLVEVFKYCGFGINVDKSFANTEGPFFRESCGKHYLNGRDVTPFYVDTALDTFESILLLANNLTRWSVHGGCRDGRLHPVWKWVVAHLPRQALDRAIPFGESNDGLILDWDEVSPAAAFLEDAAPNPELPALLAYGTSYDPGLRSQGGLYGRTFVGWTVHACEIDARAPKLKWDHERYPVFMYMRSVRKFSAPKKADDPFLDQCAWLKDPMEIPSNAVGLKTSLFLRRRVVITWPVIGPWVFHDVVISTPVTLRSDWAAHQGLLSHRPWKHVLLSRGKAS